MSSNGGARARLSEEVYALVQRIQDLKRSLAGDEQGLFEEVMQGLFEALEQ